MTFWITVAVPTAMKDYICKLSIVSYVTKHRASGTSLLITQAELLLPPIDPRTELKLGNF